MSHSIDECYTVYAETERRARKSHKCSACKERIEPGDFYWHVFMIYEGFCEAVKRCLRCQEIHLHLRKLNPGELWPAEKLDCGERYEENWGRVPEDIAALAFKTREQLQQERKL